MLIIVTPPHYSVSTMFTLADVRANTKYQLRAEIWQSANSSIQNSKRDQPQLKLWRTTKAILLLLLPPFADQLLHSWGRCLTFLAFDQTKLPGSSKMNDLSNLQMWCLKSVATKSNFART